MDVKSMLKYYILKRWTKIEKNRELPITVVSDVVEDVDFSPTQCYKDMCPCFIKIVTEACTTILISPATISQLSLSKLFNRWLLLK
jgi:hypothetical protein